MTRSRSWCFTLNNWTQEEYDTLKEKATTDAAYMIVGKEVGEEGTPHLQGYVNFKDNKKSLGWMKTWLPRAHFEIARGNDEQNRTYCSKGNDYVEIGIPPSLRKRNGQQAGGTANQERYIEAYQAAKKGKWDEIPGDIMLKHYGNIKKIYADSQDVPTSIEELDFHWFWGPTGSGKSKTAREKYPNAYLKDCNKWWDGYDADKHDAVIIDEWDPDLEKFLASKLKKWADHHPFAAEIKGGTICIRPRAIVITSNYSIEDCFKDHRNLDPLRRRFKVTHFSGLA